MRNPFLLKALPPDRPFCDREKELEELKTHARNGADVVVSSPRRFGKTSLVFRALDRLRTEGYLTIYTSFDQVDSPGNAAGILAQGIVSAIRKRETVLEKGMRWAKSTLTEFVPAATINEEGRPVFTVTPKQGRSGTDLLSRTLKDLECLADKLDGKVVVVFDEFQEISRLPDSAAIEGLLRTRVQEQHFSHIFVGSRRSVLEAMFVNRGRPFFKSAILTSLPPLPSEDLVAYYVERFGEGGKKCPEEVAALLASRAQGYGFYAQQLGYYAFTLSGETVTEEDAERAFSLVTEQASPGFEGLLATMKLNQVRLLKALAAEPASKMMSGEYLQRHGLVASNVSYARNVLVDQDLIESGRDRRWKLTDHVFAQWLARDAGNTHP